MGLRTSRREWLRGSVGGLAVLLRLPRAGAQTTPVAASAEWPLFRGDPALRGVGRSPLPESPKLLWTFEAESEPTSPVAAEGRAFLATRDGDLIALDIATGKLVWKVKVAAGFEGAPTCASDLVLAPDLEGAVHAFGFADGKKVWSHQTAGKSEIKASVAVDQGTALVGSYDGTLHALNLRDGAPRWTFESEAQIHATCAVVAGIVYFAGCDGHFRGLDIATGGVKLDVPFGGYTAASPAIASGLAVFGTFGNEVVGIDMVRKRILWRYVPTKAFPFYSSAALAGGSVYVGSRDKALHVLDLETGRLQWTFETQGKIDSSPVFDGSRVFFGSHDGRIRGLDVKTRKSTFSYETGAPVATSPAIAQDRLLVASTDGRILCFG